MPRKEISRYVEDPLIRSMRVRAWFQAVTKTSGLTTHELEREFCAGEGNPRSCIWNKYRRGEVVPRSAENGDGGPKLVERVEGRYPGTAIWLLSPLWRLVDNEPMEMSEIRRIYDEMPSSIRSIFVLPDDKFAKIFWRKLTEPEYVCEILLRFRDVNALVALLTMLREAEITQNREQYRFALGALAQIIKSGTSLETSECAAISELVRYLRLRLPTF